MAHVQIFDPPLCCPTGVCGPAIDPELARVSADLEWLKTNGVQVSRFNLAQQPGDFAGNETVRQALHAKGNECLPLVLVDGRIVAEGTYPSRDVFAALAGIVIRSESAPKCAPKADGSKCC
ncbi:arsenite efflux transporter metallochaperone ArsD [Vulgatibacter sp.]|uniref:arsenite efflux transporter metallochaperone ArsD n=1 Tax=Vulgatibacter sp. TaxID=1971226 RepID=UPI0035657430